MRFGYLTYGLDRPLSGIARTTQELGRELASRPDCEPVFLTPYARGPFADGSVRRSWLPGARLLPALMSLGVLEVAAAARRHALELVHDPTSVSPFLFGRRLGRFKRVVTLHDAIAFRYPQGYTRLNVFLHRHYVPATLRHVDAVITVSEDARRDLIHFLKLPQHKVHVIPWAPATHFRPLPPTAAAETAERYGLRAPFVLYAGALEARKNVPTLLRAFSRLRTEFPALTLGVVGRPTWKYDEIPRTLERLDLGANVRFTGYVPDVDLPALFGAASVFCFPSFYEGFGMPVLEAMACGAPVVCAAASSIPEVAGTAALLVDPRDEAALVEALGRVLREPGLADELRRRGLARAAEFTWSHTADLTVSVYRSVLEAGGSA